MPRSGSVYRAPGNTRQLKDWLEEVYRADAIRLQELRAARAKANADFASASPSHVVLVPAPEPIPQPPAHYIIVSHSDPRKRYNVVLYPTRGECECAGYKYRRNCSHIDEAKSLHDAGLGGIYGA